MDGMAERKKRQVRRIIVNDFSLWKIGGSVG